MTEISAASPNEEEQEQEISIREFMKTQKQFIENMQLMFQKHATTTSMTQLSELYGPRADGGLMMHRSRRFMTELFTKKSLVQVEKENA